jgi:hypothetical protein
MLYYFGFTEKEIISFAHKELESAGLSTKISELVGAESNILLAKTTRGAKLVMPVTTFGKCCVLAFRGIHRIVDKRRDCSTFFNGQAAKNLDTLTFTGEQGMVHYGSVENSILYYSNLYRNSNMSVSDFKKKVSERVSYDMAAIPHEPSYTAFALIENDSLWKGLKQTSNPEETVILKCG